MTDRVESRSLRSARRIVLILVTVELAVLVVTGVILYFKYRPTASAGWSDSFDRSSAATFSRRVRLVHHATARLAIPTVLAAAGLVAATVTERGRRWTSPALGSGLLAMTLFGSFTGYLLPWDQLALSAVTVGAGIDGFDAIVKENVLFVIIGGVEVGTTTILRWLAVHTIGIGLGMSALTGLAWRAHRSAGRVGEIQQDADPSVGQSVP